MKFSEPEYAKNVIVGVIFHNVFAWYVTDRDYWYLDYTKYERDLISLGYKEALSEDFSFRFGIAVLNESTAELFLSLIEALRTTASTLSEMMLTQRKMYEEYSSLDSQEYRDDILDFVPCFLVNFDRKQLYSMYPEMIRFELYVPEGWSGIRKDFQREIPEKERYWIVNGHNLFE